jgi:isocitrate dehydrogenase
MLVPGAVWDGDTLLDLLKAISSSYRWMHVEKLDQVDGEPGFTRAQGENAIDPS